MICPCERYQAMSAPACGSLAPSIRLRHACPWTRPPTRALLAHPADLCSPDCGGPDCIADQRESVCDACIRLPLICAVWAARPAATLTGMTGSDVLASQIHTLTRVCGKSHLFSLVRVQELWLRHCVAEVLWRRAVV